MPAVLSPPDLSAEVVVASSGMSKGISQTDGIQVVVHGRAASGPLFISALVKNIASEHAHGELQVTAGADASYAEADISMTIALKRWISANGSPDRTAAEFSASAARPFGRFTPKVQLSYSPDDLGDSRRSIYVEGGLSWQPRPHWQVAINVGRRGRHGGIDYTSANLAVRYDFERHFSAEIAAYGTNRASDGSPYKSRIVASLRAVF